MFIIAYVYVLFHFHDQFCKVVRYEMILQERSSYFTTCQRRERFYLLRFDLPAQNQICIIGRDLEAIQDNLQVRTSLGLSFHLNSQLQYCFQTTVLNLSFSRVKPMFRFLTLHISVFISSICFKLYFHYSLLLQGKNILNPPAFFSFILIVIPTKRKTG